MGIVCEKDQVEEVIQENLDNVFNYAYRLCGSTEQAEKLTCNALEFAHTRCGALKLCSEKMIWMYRLLTNRYLFQCKNQKPSKAADSDQSLEVFLDSLPAYQRVVLVLKHIEGMSEIEMSKILDLPIQTLKRRVEIIDNLLQKRWSQYSV